MLAQLKRAGRRRIALIWAMAVVFAVAPALAAGLFALYATDLVSITLRTFNA